MRENGHAQSFLNTLLGGVVEDDAQRVADP